MDGFFEVMVRDKNPQAPQLVSIVKQRETDFTKRMEGVAVAPAIQQWAGRMMKRQKDAFGLDYVVYGHQPMDYVCALMCARYGMDEKQWPEAFSPDDLSRGLGWENGRIPTHVLTAQKLYFQIAGGSELTDYEEARIGNGLFRTGLTTTTAWQASTAYSLGDQIRASTWDDTIYECVVAGTSGGSEPTWSTGIGTETTDNTVTWQAMKIGPLKQGLWFALYTASPGETGGGTEVSAGGYARVPLHPGDSNWTASSQVSGAGRNDNAAAIQFGTPSANWGTVTDTAILSRLTGGNMTRFTPLTTAKTVNNGDPGPSFPVGAFDIDHS